MLFLQYASHCTANPLADHGKSRADHARLVTDLHNMSVQINWKNHFAMRRVVDCPTHTDIDVGRAAVFGGTHEALGQAMDMAVPIIREFCQQPGLLSPYNVLSH
jgi:hypothetical protein